MVLGCMIWGPFWSFVDNERKIYIEFWSHCERPGSGLNWLKLWGVGPLYMTRYISPRNSVGGDIVMRPLVCAWVSVRVRECVGESRRAWVRPSHFALWTRYSFHFSSWSLSNFTCKMRMMRGGTLLILDHGVKGQGQFWHSVYKTLCTRYRLQLLSNHFQTSHVGCGR